MSSDIALCKKRIENWSKEFNQQLQGEIERFASYVKDQCELHRYRILEELENLENGIKQAKEVDDRVDSHADLTYHENLEIEPELPRKRLRSDLSTSSPENRKKTLRRSSQRSSLNSEREGDVSNSRRSLRKKSRVSYITDDDEILDSSPESRRDRRITFPNSSDHFHQLLSSTPTRLVLSESLPSPLPPSPPPTSILPIQIPLVIAPSSSSSSYDLLNHYQCYIMKLLSSPAPQRYQFRHYQDIYYLWGGYFQTRPFAMSYKLIMDFLHFYSDQNNFDGRSNTRYMRQAVHNLLRSGDLVLLDAIDESSVFVSLDDDKDCITHKHMIAVPLPQQLIDEHLKQDQEIIDELVQVYYEVYCNFAIPDSGPGQGTGRSSGNTFSSNSSISNTKSPENAYVPLLKLQQQFIRAIQAGECQKICQRFPQPHSERPGSGQEENIPWEHCLPPHELWRMYRRYEMANINYFHKYLEAKRLVQLLKTNRADSHLQWIANVEEDSDSES
jgi:hypothetical protein